MSDTTITETTTGAPAPDSAEAKRLERNARRREQRRAAAREREDELEVVADLAAQLIRAGEDPYTLQYAEILRDGAVDSGQPSDQVRWMSLDSEGDEPTGWQGTQYQSAYFSCRSYPAAVQVAKEYGLRGPPYTQAMVDQRRRVIARVIRGAERASRSVARATR